MNTNTARESAPVYRCSSPECGALALRHTCPCGASSTRLYGVPADQFRSLVDEIDKLRVERDRVTGELRTAQEQYGQKHAELLAVRGELSIAKEQTLEAERERDGHGETIVQLAADLERVTADRDELLVFNDEKRQALEKIQAQLREAQEEARLGWRDAKIQHKATARLLRLSEAQDRELAALRALLEAATATAKARAEVGLVFDMAPIRLRPRTLGSLLDSLAEAQAQEVPSL